MKAVAEATIKAKTVTNFIVDVYDILILPEFVLLRLRVICSTFRTDTGGRTTKSAEYYNSAHGATSAFPKFHYVEGKSCVYVVC